MDKFKKIQIVRLALVGLVGSVIITGCSFRSMTGFFFGVNVNPVEMPLKRSFEPRKTDQKTKEIVNITHRFIDSLDAKQKQALLYELSDNAQRSNWSNFPEGMIPRGGLKLGEMTSKQRELLDDVLAQVLSEKGVQNIEYQLAAEDTFEAGGMLKYGTDYFYVAILGTPSETQPWMFQFGGHHLAINVTIYGADASFSPMLTGGQPLNIRYKNQDVFITRDETEAAQRLMSSLSGEQKAKALRGEHAIDLLLGPGEYGTVVAPEGLKGSELSKEQKRLLVQLITTRLGFINPDDFSSTMATVLAELDDTYFGWWGPTDKLGFAYFRVTGPSLVLEYSPQDDEGDATTEHAHSMYRNPKNDYGVSWIGKQNEIGKKDD
ncbi:DUF3500 domain-containing protein [Parashewanella tropica]|uniref:DUF3500 domain-containing protein n=1 Tax=Parashewanella tropica TaxID=2547970 RepID=UPI00105A6FE0|nr:DUF3500 domain-containing protein [Parashewanella tropica]